MSVRQRLAQVVQIFFLAFILVAIGFLSAVTAIRFGIRGKQVEVPNLVGSTVAQARVKLRLLGVPLQVAGRIYSDQPADEIIK